MVKRSPDSPVHGWRREEAPFTPLGRGVRRIERDVPSHLGYIWATSRHISATSRRHLGDILPWVTKDALPALRRARTGVPTANASRIELHIPSA